MQEKHLKLELKKTNELIELHTKNLIHLLNKVNIEYINLIQYHYTFRDLILKRNDIENRIHNLKLEKEN